MSAPTDWTLDHFAVKSLDQGALTGVAIAVHAIKDGFLLKHSGVGCKHKTVTQLATHDWGHWTTSREGWTEVGDAELIAGGKERIGAYARAWQARVEPAVMVVISVTFLDLTGDDYLDVCKRLDEELPCHVMYVKCPGYEGDLYSGYLATQLEVLKRADWSAAVTQSDEIAFLGYFWDRYEGDNQGNLMQLRSLMQSIGLTAGPVWFSGTSFAELAAATASGALAVLPYAAPKLKTIARTTKRPTVQVELPIGLRGTAAFLRAIGKARAVPEARIEAVIRKQEDQTRRQVGQLADRLRGQRVAIFADVPLAAALVSLTDELGLIPAVVGLRGHSLGGRAALDAALARLGAALPADVEVIEHPSMAQVRDAVARRVEAGTLDGVLGSATDLNAVSTIPASAYLRRYAGEPMQPQGPWRLEVGFPCREHHCAYAMPTFGYMGVMIWVQRLLSAPRLFDAGRSVWM